MHSVRSPNCKLTKNASHSGTCVYTSHQKSDPSKTFTGFVATCQDGNVDTPDDETRAHMLKIAAKGLSSPDYTLSNDDVVLDDVLCEKKPGAHGSLDIDGLLRHRMASNCAPGFSVSNVNTLNTYKCYYHGERVDEDGNRGYNLSDAMTGRFASCEGGGFDSRTEEDIKKIVAYQMDNGKYTVDTSKMRCDISSLPMAM